MSLTRQSGPIRCEICGRMFSARHYGTHKRKQHGIYGGVTGRVRRQPDTQTPTTAVAPATVTTERINGMITDHHFRALSQFVVLEDNDGGLWLAERIR